MNVPPLPLSNQFVCGVTELVRGQEQEFLDELQPLVQRQPVRLDLSRIERIDAAGLAALISLYTDACKAGQEFTVVNPSRHVAQILALVGLDRILVAPPEAPCAGLAGMHLQETAA